MEKTTAIEQILAHSYKAEMVAYIKANPADCDKLICLALYEDKPHLAWRAAWLLVSVMSKNDRRLQPFVEQIIEMLPVKNSSLNRELLMILQRMEIDRDCEGKLFDKCISIWENLKTAQSVRYNALKLLLQITRCYPELQYELDFLLDRRYMESCTKGIQHSLRKMIEKAKTDKV